MTTYEDARWESRLPYFENNETWSLIDFLQWSIVFAKSFGDKQDEHLLYKVCLEKLRLKPQLLKSCSSELVDKLVSNCISSFEKDIKSSKVKEFWNNSSTVMEAEALSNTTRETIQPALKRKLNEGEMTVDAGNNPFYVSQHEKDPKNATNQNEEDEMLNEKVELPNHKKAKKEVKNTSRTKTQKSRNKRPDDDEEIKFDFTSVEMELLREQSNEWKVSTVNVSQRFKNYQIETLEKAKIYGLKWSGFHEVLALSSIIVLSLHCPYHIFTGREWQTIIRENPYIVADSILPTEILSFLWSASADSLKGKTAFLSIGDSEIGRVVSRIFNNM
ncbi:18887_t:CDS:2 [Funneliformis geosporum]|uniref:18887_t:CDS:1 n=1 Tax=Funneliformis geosporum TaxID=1117311 RepID=A0A9W4SS12_9GLOM|nr:18887_t:CDS:2 [Funneliformis geosporum]